MSEYTLLRSQINYHNFSITQEHLQQAVQVTVVFTAPPHMAFPVKILFRYLLEPQTDKSLPSLKTYQPH